MNNDLRRIPQRTRGQQRVDKILDAAAQVFAQVGYEAATTNQIAAAAETSIGSLYQFFPNKQVILTILAERYLTKLREIYDTLLTPDAYNMPLNDLLDKLIDSLAVLHTDHPGFGTIFYGDYVTPELNAASHELHLEVIGRVERLLSYYIPNLEPSRYELVATVSVGAVKALLPMTETTDHNHREQVLNEIKILLQAYFKTLFAD